MNSDARNSLRGTERQPSSVNQSANGVNSEVNHKITSVLDGAEAGSAQNVREPGDFRKMVLEEANQMKEGLFTAFQIRRAIAERFGLPIEAINPYALVGLRGCLSPTGPLVKSGAIELMIGMRWESVNFHSFYPFRAEEANFVNTRGRLTASQYRRFQPRVRNGRYPIVYRITHKATELLKGEE